MATNPIFQTSDAQPKVLPLPSFDRTPLFNQAAGNGAVILPNIPTWGQLTEWTPSSTEAPEAHMNCGPMCLSMCIKAITGVTCPAVYIHDMIHGPDVVEGTTLEQLSWYLKEIAEIPNDLATATNADELTSLTNTQIKRGRPYIELMYFAQPNDSYLHYRLGFGHDPFECMMVDPWYASIVKYGHARHWEMSTHALCFPRRPVRGWKQ